MFRFLTGLIFSIILCFSGTFCFARDLAVVERIVDGDTIRVIYQNKSEPVRLIGIDTPESRRNKRVLKQARENNQDVETIISMGLESKKYVNSLIKAGDKVYLEFDVSQRDRYRRILAYVWLQDGRMLNEVIVKNGYATVYTVPPNVKYKDRFLEAQRYARENNLGLWKE